MSDDHRTAEPGPVADGSPLHGDAYLQSLIAVLPDRLLVVDAAGTILDVHCPPDLPGLFPPERTLGQPVWGLLAPQDVPRARDALARAAAGGGVATVAVDVVFGAQRLPFECRMVRVADDRLLCIARDVGANRDTQLQLRDGQEELLALRRALPDRLLVLDETGTVVDAHIPGHVRLQGGTGALLGRQIEEILPAEVAALTRGAVGEVIAGRGPVQRSFALPRPGREPLQLQATFGPLGHDKVLSLAHDVTGLKRATDALRDSDARFRRLLDSIQEIVFEVGADLRTTGAFGGYTRELRVQPDHYLGLEVGHGQPPELVALHRAHHERAFAGETVDYQWSLPTPDGRTRHYETRLSPIREAGGVITGVVGVGRDVTARRDGEDALAHQTQLYETLVRALGELGTAIVVCEGETVAEWAAHVVFQNEGFTALTGRSAAELAGLGGVTSLVSPAQLELLALRLADAAEVVHFETVLHHKDGRALRVEVAGKRFQVAGRRGLVVVARDVSEQTRMLEELERRAFYDELTGLANRSLLTDRLDNTLAMARRSGAPVGLLVMDLDRFKDVNDTFGHAAGDQLLREIAARLRTLGRDGETIARLGGDEFAFVLPGTDGPLAALAAARLLKALETPFHVEGHAVDVGASVGIALGPGHGDLAHVLLRRADIAMHAAKAGGLGQAIYEPRLDRSSAARLSLTSELRQAIEQGELEIYLQPQVGLSNRRVKGMEALVRWPHPRRGLLSPTEFVPLAEQSSLIRPLTAWVVGDALRCARELSLAGWKVPVAVNLSMRNLIDPDLPRVVERALARSGVAPEMLELELTESAIMDDAPRAMRVLGQFREMGVRVAIDDFGTGYSSLAYLHRLPLDVVKIDRSFVTNMSQESGSAAIVRSTVDLAHHLKFEVVAEGVEDVATWHALGLLGCDAAQGYYISHPKPLSAFTAWMAAGAPYA